MLYSYSKVRIANVMRKLERNKKLLSTDAMTFVICWLVCYLQYGCIVSSCVDGSVKVWSHRGIEITTLHGHSQRVNGCHLLVTLSQLKQPGP